MSRLVAGFDVGGVRKGFHRALLDLQTMSVVEVRHFPSTQGVESGMEIVAACAIDAPSRAVRPGPETRLAERELAAMGYRIQWTRAVDPPEWMLQGEALWRTLEARVPRCQLLETFPTAASDLLAETSVVVPVSVMNGAALRPTMKDFWDACVCAVVAARFVRGEAKKIGSNDPLGPIYL